MKTPVTYKDRKGIEQALDLEISNTRGVIIEEYPCIDYILVYRPNCDDYVAAWHYNEESGSWGQGHYFEELNTAVSYIQDILIRKDYGRR